MMILDVMPIGPADIAAFRIGQGRAALQNRAILGRLAQDQFVTALADDPPRIATFRQPVLFPGASHPMWSRGPLDFSHLSPRAQEALRGIQEQQELAYLFPPQMQHTCAPPPFFNPYAFNGCYMPQFNRQIVNPALIPGLNMNPLAMNFGRNNPGMVNPLIAGL